MKILNVQQIRKADQYTIQHEPVSSVDLMERAAKAFCKEFQQDYPSKDIPVFIICGPGNNGGDGLAIARLLTNSSYQVKVYIFPESKQSADFKINLRRLESKNKRIIHEIKNATFIDDIPQSAIVIDGIFGTGLKEGIQQNSLFYAVIENLNYRNFENIISIDIPSGLPADVPAVGIAVAASKIYTFQFPKLAFLLPETARYTGDFKILDIGLHSLFIEEVKTSFFYTTLDDIRDLLIKRKKYSHKGIYGHALIVAGSYGKTGAAILASNACLRSGAGLVTAHLPSSSYKIFQTAIAEAMFSADADKQYISGIPQDEKYNSIGIGPGIGTHEKTIHALETFLKNYKKPVVMDADALNILSMQRKLIKHIPAGSVLTPHPKEFERLAGKWKNDFHRLELQSNFSKKNKVILVLKGAHSSISDMDGNIYFNSTGNPGMATGGCGDVLTGIITGLLAQHYTPLQSAILGVYIHGLAGDLALKDQSMESMIASDITAHLGGAFKEIEKHAG